MVPALLLRVATLIVELIGIAGLTAAAAIAAGFSGTFHLGPWPVSMTSARNPLTIAAVALVLRALAPEVPLLGFISTDALRRRAADAWKRTHDALVTMTPRQASRLVFVVMTASLALKLVLAYRHPGFWTGDDVEIHEMTFARLFGYSWRPWELRSPVYPLGIVYPVQALLAAGGQTDPAGLIFAGRALVATFTVATLWLTFHVARRLFDGMPIAILAVLVLATNKLHVMTGTTELPRPVASFFVLLAFWLLLTSRRHTSAGAAGALIGLAAAMRFSEEVFVVPALIQLALARRWQSAIAFGMGFAIVCATAFGLVDLLYFGEPFFSLRHIVDFTLTHQQSTRGFQPWYEYLSAIPSWTNVVVAALAVYGAIKFRPWTLIAWAATPVIALSMLPHKEPRYLVPMLPYFAMLAAAGLWQVIVSLQHTTHQRERARLALAAVVIAVLITEPAAYVLPRSDDGVAIARHIAAQDATGGLLAEPAWNLGGRLYLPRSNPFIDIDPSQMGDRSRIEERLQDRNLVWLVFQDRDVQRFGYEQLIAESGFDEVRGLSPSYRIFRRR